MKTNQPYNVRQITVIALYTTVVALGAYALGATASPAEAKMTDEQVVAKYEGSLYAAPIFKEYRENIAALRQYLGDLDVVLQNINDEKLQAANVKAFQWQWLENEPLIIAEQARRIFCDTRTKLSSVVKLDEEELNLKKCQRSR